MEQEKKPTEIYLETKDFSVSEEVFHLESLHEGTLLKTVPTPPEELLPLYYENPDYLSHSDGNTSLFEKTYQWVKCFAAVQKLRQIEKFCNTKGNLIDVGAGTGDFLLTARKRGWKVTGTEPNPQARAKAEKKGIPLVNNTQSLQGGQFQVVTLWHVLEHVPDFDAQIKEIHRLLVPGGVAVIAVPNFKCYSARFYKKYWAAYDVPRHLWHFSKTFLIATFHKNKFSTLGIKPLWQDAYYINLLSEKHKTGHMRILPAFFRATLCNLKGITSINQSALTYFFKKSD